MKPNRKNSFTLIELLVVVAIIAVLVALLLPSLQQARSRARELQCQSNMKQIHFMIHQYTLDNSDFLPPARLYNGPTSLYYNWRYHWYGLLFETYVQKIGNSDPQIGGGSAWKAMYCPDTFQERTMISREFSSVGYMYSWMIHNGHQFYAAQGPIGRLGYGEMDEKRVVIHCAGRSPYNISYASAEGAPYCTFDLDWYINYLARKHRNGTNFLTVSGAIIWVPDLGSNNAYKDGHNNYIRWW